MTDKTKNIIQTAILGVFLLALSLFCWFKPADDYSQSERRALAQMPEFNAETVFSGRFMKDFETYTLDQFPLRDSFRSIKAVSELYAFRKMDNNDIYITDSGVLSKLEYPMNTAMLDHAAERFRYLYDTYMKDTDCKVYFSIIPDKNYVTANLNGHLELDYDALTDYMLEKTSYMEYIDIFPFLSLADYYKTDTHWRQENIVDVAQHISQAMGVEQFGVFEYNDLQYPFHGVYSDQSALPVEPEQLIYLTSDTLDNCTVTSWNTGMPVKTEMYNMEKAAGPDAYDIFLGGADPLIVIENPMAETDRELIVFRDSFGSSLSPLLVEGYAKVTVVDIRYLNSSLVGNFVKFDDQDVLIIYSTMLLNSSLGLK